MVTAKISTLSHTFVEFYVHDETVHWHKGGSHVGREIVPLSLSSELASVYATAT
jgi:hypothetical protein